MRIDRLEGHANRALLLVSLLGWLPVVAIAERVRRGAGRAVALLAVRTTARLLRVRFESDGCRPLATDGPAILVPNHRSPLDIPAVLSARPRARFVAAAELFRIPLLAGAMRALGTIPVARGDGVGARARLAALAQDLSGDVVIFAEGGIVEGDGVTRLRSGAFRLAIATGAPIVPVAIHGAANLLGAGQRLKVRSGTVSVECGAAIDTTRMAQGDVRELRDRTRAAITAALDAKRT